MVPGATCRSAEARSACTRGDMLNIRGGGLTEWSCAVPETRPSINLCVGCGPPSMSTQGQLAAWPASWTTTRQLGCTTATTCWSVALEHKWVFSRIGLSFTAARIAVR